MMKQGTVSILAHVLLVLKNSAHICKHDTRKCNHSLTGGTDNVVGNCGS